MNQYRDMVFPNAYYSGDKVRTALDFKEALIAYLQANEGA